MLFRSCLIQLQFSWVEPELVTELNNFLSMSECIFYVRHICEYFSLHIDTGPPVDSSKWLSKPKLTYGRQTLSI